MKTYQRRSPLTEEQKKLIEDNLDFCYYWMNLHGIKNEDRQQSLLTAICSYIHLYDPEKGAITTFMSSVMSSRNKSLNQREYSNCRVIDKYSVSINDEVSNLDENCLTWEDILVYSEEGFEKFETDDYYKNVINYVERVAKISPKNLKILIAYMNTGNMKEVARMYGCTHQNVSRICREVKLKLKRWKKVYDEIYC